MTENLFSSLHCRRASKTSSFSLLSFMLAACWAFSSVLSWPFSNWRLCNVSSISSPKEYTDSNNTWSLGLLESMLYNKVDKCLSLTSTTPASAQNYSPLYNSTHVCGATGPQWGAVSSCACALAFNLNKFGQQRHTVLESSKRKEGVLRFSACSPWSPDRSSTSSSSVSPGWVSRRSWSGGGPQIWGREHSDSRPLWRWTRPRWTAPSRAGSLRGSLGGEQCSTARSQSTCPCRILWRVTITVMPAESHTKQNYIYPCKNHKPNDTNWIGFRYKLFV